MELINRYSYLDTIGHYLLGYPVQLCDEYHLSGSRYSGKTISIDIAAGAHAIGVALQTNKRVALYAFRKMNKDIDNLADDMQQVLTDAGYVPGTHYKLTRPNRSYLFTFANGSFIAIKGVHIQANGHIALKGLASALDFDLTIKWREEANEFDRRDQEAIDFAVRGAKRTITITSCNPDVLYNDHITYLNDRLPFDFDKMSTQFEQKAIIVENNRRKLFHYTNWKVNPYLSNDEVRQLEELLVLDPEKAYCWYWGMPGNVSTSIFTRYVGKAFTSRNWPVSRYLAGVDIGQADSPTGHPTACSLWLYGKDNGVIKAFKQSEFYHSNATMNYLNSIQLVQAVVNYYRECAMRYPAIIQQMLSVKVDYGNGGLAYIDMLNAEAAKQQLRWLEFVPVDKTIWFTKDRVDFTQLAIMKGYLGYNWSDCPHTLRQMNLIQWQEQTSKTNFELKMLDLHDDTWDSDCYALFDVMRDMMGQNTNNLLRQKGALW